MNTELNQLSLEVFGSSSKWKKIVENGELVPVLEETTRVTFDADGKENQEEVTTQVMHAGKNGEVVPKYELKRYTEESIKAKMLQLKGQREQLMAAYKAQQQAIITEQEAVIAKQEALKALSKASGSASV